MRVNNGLGSVEKHNAVHRGHHILNHRTQIGVHDLGQQLPLLHPGVDLGLAQEESGGVGLDVHHGAALNEL